ncbi:MAG TPA: GNAT family N-acetyltransferase [Sphingomonas sp.]|nr:GNAT family N-acetyltransferase [Sphingomonas sp.]
MSAVLQPLKFQVGARTLWSIPRRLIRVPLSLADVLEPRAIALPQFDDGADGILVTSLPEARMASVTAQAAGLIAFVRQRYTRYYADLNGGFEGYLAGMSANTRSGLKRKAKKLAAQSGGSLNVRAYRTPDELAAFHALARPLSALTYQESLLGAGLPDTPAFVQSMLAMAAADRVRAWLLFIDGRAVAYLYCPAEGDTLRYEYLGHDPEVGHLSVGSVLQLEAMRSLFAEGRFARFDFTEGEGQHKRQFATGGVACVDLMLLRSTLANRAAIAALAGFDRTMAAAKRATKRLRAEALVRRLRRR